MSLTINHQLNSISTDGTSVLDLGMSTALNLPKGSTINRPSSPVAGAIRYNIDSNNIEYYQGGLTHDWVGFLQPSNNLLELTDTNQARTNLGLSIGADVQAQSANLQALANVVVSGNDQQPYFVNPSLMSTYTVTPGGRTMLGNLGSANTFVYFTSPTTSTTTPITAGGRSMVANVGAADTFVYFTSPTTSTTTPITAYGRSLLSAAGSNAAISALGLGGVVRAWGYLYVRPGYYTLSPVSCGLLNSFNISSITQVNGNGIRLNFTNPLPSAYYAVVVSSDASASVNGFPFDRSASGDISGANESAYFCSIGINVSPPASLSRVSFVVIG